MTVTDRIELDPKVMLDAYPRLTRDIKAAIGYAADTLAHEETLLISPGGAKPGA